MGALLFGVQTYEIAVVDSCDVVASAGGAGFVGEAAEGFCGAGGGDFCDLASFAGVPVNGFIL